MKKIILCLMALALLLCLCGCKNETNEPAPETDMKPEHESETATEPENVPEPEPVDPDRVFYFSNYLEKDRLYRQNLDGSDLTLICDEAAYEVTEMGDYIYFTNRNAVLCRCPITGGEPETVFSDCYVYRIRKVNDTTLLFSGNGRIDLDRDIFMTLFAFDTVSGKVKIISTGISNTDYVVGNGKALYSVYNTDTYATEYRFFDAETGESRMCDYTPLYGAMFACGDYIYEQDLNEGTWYRYSFDTEQREPADIGLLSEFDMVLGFDGTSFLVQDTREEAKLYKVTGTERTFLQNLNNDGNSYCVYAYQVAQKGDTVIFNVQRDKVTDGGDYYSTEWKYYAISMSTGEMTDITALGESGKMFSNGDFPQMDVSTARKPLASSICDLFFRQYGIKGAEPMNSKSHGAWLNLADKGCDIILVPAPTDEEKAYLDERNVDVDMKAFCADGLVFISGTGSGVTNLSLEQLKAIYRGEITNWKEVGGVDHKITVYYRNDQSGSQRQFEKLVWKNEDIPDFEKLGYSIMDDMISIVVECQEDPYAIGYTVMTYLSDTFENKNVCLLGIDGVVPGIDTVSDGSYSLSLQDCVVIRSDEAENSPARRLYNWFDSPQCGDILLENGLTPIHSAQ